MVALVPAKNPCTVIHPCKKTRLSQPLQVRAQIHRDHEEKSSDIVNTNLRVLRVRIEEVKNRERLERCCLAEWGWNYAPVQSLKSKRDEEIVQFLQLMGMVGGTFGITIFSCSFCLCIISLFVHLNQWLPTSASIGLL